MPRSDRWLVCGWVVFVAVMVWSMFRFPTVETIPYHATWASFALLFGLRRWPTAVLQVVFVALAVVTAVPVLLHAGEGRVWQECYELVALALIVWVAMWHLSRSRALRLRSEMLSRAGAARAEQRELATRLGSHEVRTRLTVARGLVDLIGCAVDDPAVRGDIEIILSELDKAVATVTKLLVLVRLEAPGVRHVTDVDELIELASRRWSRPDRKWRIHSYVSTTLIDGERLEAALDALIENAVKFSRPGDEIGVEARLDGDAIVVSVSDTGRGIPPDDLECIFGAFTTGRLAGGEAGSGLGLSIVQAAVEERSGSVEVVSEVGTGTCFTLRFSQHASLREDWRSASHLVREPVAHDSRS